MPSIPRMCRRAVLLLLVFSVTLPGLAALSKEHAEFPKGPAELLFTKEERARWKSVSTDEQARAFIDLFWARRDPTPGTPANEFRASFEERVKVADGRFTSNSGPGARSDRGKVFILMGSPTKIRRSGSGPTQTIQQPTRGMPARPGDLSGGVQGFSPKEVWEYEQGQVQIQIGQPLARVAFIDQYATNDWKMERVPQTDYGAVFELVASANITQPDLKSAPVFNEVSRPVPAAMPSELTSELFRTAVHEARGGAVSDRVFLSYGEFITPEGEHFVPVQLYVPASAGLNADAAVTFFGTIEKEGGEKVASFEEGVKLAPTRDGVFYARSLTLPAGSYRAAFGLARDGKPLGVATSSMTITGLVKDAPAVSSLMLSNNVYTLPQAQMPTDPFAFGGLKVVPKSDGAFRKTDDLWLFFEARNPGLDPESQKPKLLVRFSLTGTTTEGKPVKMSAPPDVTPGLPMNGVPGHFAIGQSLTLASFKPGDYSLSVKVTDQVLNRSYELAGSFKVVE